MRARLTFIFTLALAAAGCGGATPPQNSDSKPTTDTSNAGTSNTDKTQTKSAPAKPKIVATDELPIGDPMPPLDGGKIELAKPKDWTVPSRDKKYVVQFAKGKPRFPRVVVTAEDDWSGMADVDAENVTEFVAAVAKRLKSPEHKVKLIEPVIPMVIGETAVARYVRRTKFKASVTSVVVERQMLVTVLGGRVYTIDLQTPPGTMRENRDAAYAVAASLKAVAE